MTYKGTRKLFCKKGHGLTEENVYTYTGKDGTHRRCKTCKLEWEAARYERRKRAA